MTSHRHVSAYVLPIVSAGVAVPLWFASTGTIPLLARAQAQSVSGVQIETIDRNTKLTINGCCSIDNTGKVTLAPGLQVDEASRKFWDAVSAMGMRNCKPPAELKP